MDVECRYIMPLTPKPQDKKIYIAALEDRIALLESCLSSIGQAGVGDDHWKQAQNLQGVGKRKLTRYSVLSETCH